jgi:hypothetical protein
MEQIQNCLQTFFPMLYDIVWKKSAIVVLLFGTNPLNVSFRRHLVGNNLIAWQTIVAMVSNVQLTGQHDTFSWASQQDGKFSVPSMYRV